MVSSMTGYGRGEKEAAGRKFTVELKSVNHRFCEIVWHMPRFLMSQEDNLRRLAQSKLARGRVDGFITVENCGEKTFTVRVDKALVTAYDKAMRELKEICGLKGETEISQLAALPGVITVEESTCSEQVWWPALEAACTEALGQLLAMRRTEGEVLAGDVAARLDNIDQYNRQIRQRVPLMVEEYRLRLIKRLKEWLEDVDIDESRIAAEVCLLAERTDIHEETVRLESHLEQARSCLKAGEPVGRRLDFILQEMNREINTISSKAIDQKVGQLVVATKSELEKIREQVQNIE